MEKERDKENSKLIKGGNSSPFRRMFNTLASYLLGSTTISDTGNNSTDDNKNLTDSETQLNIIATSCSDEEVDDWLLVDREGK